MRRLGELAQLVGGRVQGAEEREVDGVRSLGSAGPRDLSFLAAPRYRAAARASRAGAILASPDAVELELGADLLLCADPIGALAVILTTLHPPTEAAPGVHPTAIVGDRVTLGSGVSIGPFVVVGEGSEIGDGVALASHVVVGQDCQIGARSRLHPRVVLYDRVVLGERVEVHAGAVLGADGFGYVSGSDGHVKVPQVGAVVVGDDVEIGANSTIDRATLEATTVGSGTKIDNLVQVGHNVIIGSRCLLCGQAGVAGSTRIGDGVVLAGQVGVSGHLEIGDGVRVAAQGAVLSSVASGAVGGSPAVPLERWRKQVAALHRLPEALRRLRRLEGARGSVARQSDPTVCPASDLENSRTEE
jgi:UDP-3-O-[3-hydroxymyristoyl] glucosamine N-acyltransferase